MRKTKPTEITLMEGTFTIDEMVTMTGKARSTVKNKPKTVLENLQWHCTALRHGKGEDIIYTLSNVPTKPIPTKEFGKDPDKSRSDKGLTRDEYNTIRERFKPLIYNVLLSKPNLSHTATFSDWLEDTSLVKEEFTKERTRVQNECFYEDFTRDFINVEGDSLRRCFISALDSMSKSKAGKVSWYKRKMAIGFEGEHINLNERETTEVINIEKELCELFEVNSRSELVYKNRSKLREFDLMFKEILIDRYGYCACYTVYQVIAVVGTKNKTIEKSIQEAKELYGITEMTQEFQKSCKDEIYDSRLKKARKRFSDRIEKREEEINIKYDERLDNNWGDDRFVKFLKEIELSGVDSLDSYITQWINHYNIYIHNRDGEICEG